MPKNLPVNEELVRSAIRVAQQYWNENPEYKNEGVVTVFDGVLDGWSRHLNEPNHYREGVVCISSEENLQTRKKSHLNNRMNK